MVIDRQVGRQPALPFLGVPEGHGVGAFLAEGLDEPLGLAVDSGCVGADADVPQPQGAPSLGYA